MNNLNPDQRRKLDSLISEGIRINEEIKLKRDGLNEAIKALAEEFDVTPKLLRRVIKIASKMNLNEEREEFDAVEELLVQTGRSLDIASE